MFKPLSEKKKKKVSFPFVFAFSFLNTVILFLLQLQIPRMSWHQTHVKQINTFLHTLTSAAISLRAQRAPHHSVSLGAGCYCRRTTWKSAAFVWSSSSHPSAWQLLCILFASPVLHPYQRSCQPAPALYFCRAPCHTLVELAAAGDLRSIWAVITTLCGVNCRWYQSGHFPHPFLLLCRNILIK